MGQLQERITSTSKGSVTVQAIYAPADDHRPGAGEHVRPPRLDDRALARPRRAGHRSAVDPLDFVSRALTPGIVSEHYANAGRACRRSSNAYKDLQDIIAILGAQELGPGPATCRAPARCSASSRSRSSWPRCSSTGHAGPRRAISRLRRDHRGQARRPPRAGLRHGQARFSAARRSWRRRSPCPAPVGGPTARRTRERPRDADRAAVSTEIGASVRHGAADRDVEGRLDAHQPRRRRRRDRVRDRPRFLPGDHRHRAGRRRRRPTPITRGCAQLSRRRRPSSRRSVAGARPTSGRSSSGSATPRTSSRSQDASDALPRSWSPRPRGRHVGARGRRSRPEAREHSGGCRALEGTRREADRPAGGLEVHPFWRRRDGDVQVLQPETNDLTHDREHLRRPSRRHCSGMSSAVLRSSRMRRRRRRRGAASSVRAAPVPGVEPRRHRQQDDDGEGGLEGHAAAVGPRQPPRRLPRRRQRDGAAARRSRPTSTRLGRRPGGHGHVLVTFGRSASGGKVLEAKLASAVAARLAK